MWCEHSSGGPMRNSWFSIEYGTLPWVRETLNGALCAGMAAKKCLNSIITSCTFHNEVKIWVGILSHLNGWFGLSFEIALEYLCWGDGRFAQSWSTSQIGSFSLPNAPCLIKYVNCSTSGSLRSVLVVGSSPNKNGLNAEIIGMPGLLRLSFIDHFFFKSSVPSECRDLIIIVLLPFQRRIIIIVCLPTNSVGCVPHL